MRGTRAFALVTAIQLAALAPAVGAAAEGAGSPPKTEAPKAETSPTVLRVRRSIDDALAVLRDPKLQGKDRREERHNKLRALSDAVFDWSGMAQKSLGVHWRKLDDAQRKRFTSTFKDLLASYYLTQIDRFQGKEDVVFEGSDKNDLGLEIKMSLMTGGGEKIPIHFFTDDKEHVVDVSIEGVSIANHYRGSFDRLLVNGTFDDMMKKLERKRAQEASSSRPTDG